jgi:phytanoyl-CoA hydroxylase
VEWHQDWAFYPHSNDDVLAVGVFLNDVSADNGPLNFIPGSHRGPLFDHHDNGYFCGIADLEAEKVDVSDATPGIAPAGSVSIHHARTLHGSEANQSNEDRGLLLYEVAAGDAWPLAGGLGKPFTDLNEFNARLLCGEPVVTPRLANVPVRMPLPIHAGATSIYQLQEESGRRFYAEKMRAN